MRKQEQTATAGTFKVGDRVRVRPGVVDADYPDMPLGGWAGTVAEVHSDGMYTIRWTEETLNSIHPVFKKRCEKDGLELDTYWLSSDDLEVDSGGPLKIAQPNKITTKPLSPKDQDDRIRMIFGLTSNDPLPVVDDETLAKYHEYLSNTLVFPFTAEHNEGFGHPERIKVIGLGDPDDEPMIDEMDGILCEARMEGQIVNVPLGELENPSRNRPLIEDYGYWFCNWG